MCRSRCKIVFPLDLDLRPCLDSPSSRLRSEAVSGYGSLKSGEKMSHMGALLTRGRLTGFQPRKGWQEVWRCCVSSPASMSPAVRLSTHEGQPLA